MASEIRVDKINSLSGVGTVTLSPTGVDIAGITTAATLRATTGIVTSLTAGSLTSLGAVSGTTGTFSAAVSGTTGTFSAAVSGTTGTFTGDVDIADKITHTGDTDTAIRFPSANTISFEANGSERVRINADGKFGIGTNDPQRILHLSSNNTVVALTDTAASTDQKTKYFLSDAGVFAFGKLSDDYGTATEQFRVDNSGNLGINNTSPTHKLDIDNGTAKVNRGNSSGEILILRGLNADKFRFDTDGLKFGTDTAAANALDDYEEGNWTPTVSQGASSVTYSEQYGRYVKVGSMVTLSCRMRWTGTAADAGLRVGGLPFTAASGNGNNYTSGGITYWNVAVNYKEFDPYIGQGHNFISFYRVGTGELIKMSGNTSNSFIGLSAVFFVDF